MQKHQDWFVYLLRCADDSLYCGVTNDIDRRLAAHNAGRGARYTRSRLPVVLTAHSIALPKREAFRLEYQIKQLPAGQKVAALQGGHPQLQTTTIRHQLQQLHDALTALIDRLAAMISAL